MIELKDIHFSYNSTPVIKGISHHFEKGSFSAILGPNGSGKTTLVRMMNKIIKPLKGTISIKGSDIKEMSIRNIAKKIAYVPQFHNSLFPATVFETVLLGRNPYIRWKPNRKDEEITSEILVKLHLDEIALKDINQLSGGQRQKVFIARALAQQPEIILLDEPTANLDLRHQHEVFEVLSELSNGGITIIMAIHELNQPLKYCHQFLILDDGRVAAKGDSSIFTSELLEEIYHVKVRVLMENGQIYILPL